MLSLRTGFLLLWLSLVAALSVSCGSSSKSTTTPVISQIVITPASLSLNEGDIASISARAVDATGAALSSQPTITFSSSDASAATVSPTGSVCAGVWDASFVVCRPGQIPSGDVNIIASAPGSVAGATITASIPVSIHLHIDTITLSAPSVPCVSQNQTLQFTATAFNKGVDITSQVSNFNWTIANSQIGSIGSTTGLAVARTPGISNVYAQAAGTMSAPLALVVCAPASIQLSPSAALSMNKGDTATLQATVTDTLGNPVEGATLSFSTTAAAVARATGTVGSVTVSALTAGSFSVVASCTPPNCNSAPTGTISSPSGQTTAQALGFGFPVYSNVVPGTVAGTTTTSVFVTGPTMLSNGPANHQLEVLNSSTLALQTVVPLPNVANSMMFDQQGQKLYIGSDSGLMSLDPSSNTVTLFSGTISDSTVTTVSGKVLAISPDGTKVILSNISNGLVFIVTQNASAQVFHVAGVRSAAFSPDGFKAFLAGEGGVYDFVVTLHAVGPGAASSTSSVAYLNEGSAAYISGITVGAYATCNSQQVGAAAISAGPLVTLQSLGAPRVIGADDTQWIDLAPVLSGTSCPPSVTTGVSTANILPACTPSQIVALPDGSKVFGAGLDPTTCASPGQLPVYDVGSQTSGSIALTTGGIPLGVAATLDSQQLYVGVLNGDTATLDFIDPVAGTDKVQVSVPFVPSLVAVWPK